MISVSHATIQEQAAPQTPARNLFAVRAWLYLIAALVFAMVLVGGATRLTGSGLSITEWQPILGVVPPSSDAAWQEAFAKYQQIPEYKLVNKGMNLAEFKAIYWWEWTHRLLGRLIGVRVLYPVCFLPLAAKHPKAVHIARRGAFCTRRRSRRAWLVYGQERSDGACRCQPI